MTALVTVAGDAAGQETESPLSPAGRLRLEIAPTFISWDRRFGADGSEPLGSDLDADDAAALFGDLPTLESRIRELIDDPAFGGTLGPLRTRVSADQARVPFRLDVGALHWLTVGVTVPIVKNRTEVNLQLDPATANLGANPALTDPAQLVTYLDALGSAALSAQARAEDVCGTSPGSAECGDLTDLAADLGTFGSGLETAYGASFLFPASGSTAGEALQGRSNELDERLTAAGLDGIAPALPLGDPITDREGFDGLLESAFGTPALGNRGGPWALGDVEVHAAVRLLEGARRDSAGAPATLRWQVGAGALVRLGTGAVDDPDILLDRGAGDGQTDVEGRAFANVTWRRFGLWTDARYGVQLPTTLSRRVGPPDVVLLPPASRSVVEWTPGNYLRLELAPRYHLTDELAFAAGYRLWSKDEDTYERISEEPTPPGEPFIPTGPVFTDVTLLGLESDETRHELGLGMVYNTLDAWTEGRAPLPLEARLTVRWAVAGSGGLTAQTFRTRIGLRLYKRLWGG